MIEKKKLYPSKEKEREKIERLFVVPFVEELLPKAKDRLLLSVHSPYEIQGVLIAEIRRLKAVIKNQRKAILKLRQEKVALSQISIADLLTASIRAKREKK